MPTLNVAITEWLFVPRSHLLNPLLFFLSVGHEFPNLKGFQSLSDSSPLQIPEMWPCRAEISEASGTVALSSGSHMSE